MIYIGKIIQQTTRAIIPARKTRRINALLTQKKVLTRLIRKASITELGFQYSFDKLIKPISGVSISAFQRQVPITTYEEFYDLWLKRQLAGDGTQTAGITFAGQTAPGTQTVEFTGETVAANIKTITTS